MIKLYIAAGLVLCGLLGLQTWRLHTTTITMATERVAIANERAQASAERMKMESGIRVVENSLQVAAAQTRKESNAALQTINTDRDRLVNRLRSAEANAATSKLVSKLPSDSSAGQAITGNNGAEFPATIGEQDVQEASRADTIRVELNSCYSQYDKAAESLRKGIAPVK